MSQGLVFGEQHDMMVPTNLRHLNTIQSLKRKNREVIQFKKVSSSILDQLKV